jgi:hypothetical protein
MSLYAIVETTVVGAAVAGGAVSVLRTFAPSAFRRLFSRRKGGASKPAAPSNRCSECSTCTGCGPREAVDRSGSPIERI